MLHRFAKISDLATLKVTYLQAFFCYIGTDKLKAKFKSFYIEGFKIYFYTKFCNFTDNMTSLEVITKI